MSAIKKPLPINGSEYNRVSATVNYVVTCCVEESNKSDHQSKTRQWSPMHVILHTYLHRPIPKYMHTVHCVIFTVLLFNKVALAFV
jgi:hypothetical protein